VEIKQNHWSILKKSWISYQFIEDAIMCSHQPEYKADDKAEFIVCSNVPGFCLGVAAASKIWDNKILFIINCNE
jgi:hypothetical protein